ncbi:MAG: HDOD domain-containing protein [Nitrospirales bacterium]|nr:HDOD domain-containing protein [Nitrospirales bacterium]
MPAAVKKDGLRAPLEQLTERVGPMPTSIASMVSLAVEVFTLSERLRFSIRPIQKIWAHSLRTGFLAALISEAHEAQSQIIWRSFAGGLLHDIGLLILLSQVSQQFFRVVELASIRGATLHIMEQEVYGTTHAELGAALLSRWGGEDALVHAVGFHDDPFRNDQTQFCSASAVYLANILDGGGIAQDCDGVLCAQGEAYLRRLGLLEQVPYWQARMREIQKVPIG